MKEVEHLTYIESLFKSNNTLLVETSTSYRDFLDECSPFIEEYSKATSKFISLSPDNSREDLLRIISSWIANKTIIFHPPGTTPSKMNFEEDCLRDKAGEFVDPIACYIFTSGSTDKAKAIPLSFNNLFHAAKSFSNHYDISKNDYLPITLPLYHVGGLLIFIRTITNGASTSIHRPGNLLANTFSKSPNYLSVVPLQLERIIDTPNELDFFSDTTFIIGGAKTSKSTLQKVSAYRLKASSTYGMTETCAMVMATPVTSDLKTLMSVGSPLQDVSISFSESRTLNITTPSASPLFKDSTIKTMDLAEQRDGLFYILGRVDNVFISGGENINPTEIESTLRESGVEDPYIIPVDDLHLGQKSLLFYRGERTPHETKNLIRNVLSAHKRPRHIIKVPECAFDGIKIKKSILKDLAPHYARLDQAQQTIPFKTHGDPRNPWIILIHGFMGDKSDWDKVSGHLKEDFFIVAIDTPGHGEAPISADMSLEKYQMMFTEFSKTIQTPFHLLGYSQGGRIALGLVLRGLEVESLILESAALGIVDTTERERRYQADLKMFKNISSPKDLREFLTYWYENPLFGELKNHSNFQGLLDYKEQSNWRLWQESLKCFSVGIQPDYRILLERHKGLRALTICGERDHKYLAASKEMETRFNFKYSMIRDSSHNTHFEAPKAFVEVVSNFLKTL